MYNSIFRRYIWLINTIKRYQPIQLEQIQDLFSRYKNEVFPRRTFFCQRKAIESLFGITIRNRKSVGYYIENDNDINSLEYQLMEHLMLLGTIEKLPALRDKVLLEEPENGVSFLIEVLEAMDNNYRVKVKYKSFKSENEDEFYFEPYCIKLFKKRWYMIGRSSIYDAVRVYAMDRVIELSATKDRYMIPESFDARTFFRNSFGIFIQEGGKAEIVRLKVEPTLARFFRSLPLHHSQEEIINADGHSIFSYKLIPTLDFKQELMGNGAEVEVLEPAWLRDEIKNDINKMYSQYFPPEGRVQNFV